MATAVTPKEGKLIAPSVAETFHQYMINRASDSADDVFSQQLAAMFEAESDEDIWESDAKGTVQGRDADGVWVELHAMYSHISRRADLENSHGWFATFPGTVCLGGPRDKLRELNIKVGEEFILSSGAPLLAGKYRAFEAKNRIPLKGVISCKPGGGGIVIKLNPLPETVTPSTTA